jgi:predicted methyltransferase
MRNRLILAAVAAALIAAPMSAMALQANDLIAAAVANPARPQEDRDRDVLRKPAETLEWAGVKPGMRIMDLVPGGGYFTRILSRAVGADGRVFAMQPTEAVAAFPQYREMIEKMAAEPGYDNVSVLFQPVAGFDAGQPLDMVFTALNYHDFHADFMGDADGPQVNAAVFRALKPGGLYVIIDHHAAAGAGLADVNRLHRIDVEQVKREVLAAGFVLDGESDLLAHPDDPRTAMVFNPAIRGRTDQFMLRFRKPA